MNGERDGGRAKVKAVVGGGEHAVAGGYPEPSVCGVPSAGTGEGTLDV
jgi:hypothetical protein